MKRSILIVFSFLLFASGLRAQITWTHLLPDQTVTTFVLDTDGSIIVAEATQLNNFVRSTDSGVTWFNLSFDPGHFSELACDSGGNLWRIDESGLQMSSDGGYSWNQVAGDASHLVQASAHSLYYADMNELYVSHNSGATFDSLQYDYEIGDWAALYCGSPDQLVATQNVCSCWARFRNGIVALDTVDGNCVLADNTPPTNIFFGQDGYTYAVGQCGAIRLPPGRGVWELYDSLYSDTQTFYFAYASNGKELIFIDSTATYESTDHGSTWIKSGTGLPGLPDYSLDAEVAFTRSGVGYALVNGALYTTANVKLSVPLINPKPLLTLFPNPVESSVSIGSQSINRIRIIDLLGTVCVDERYENAANPTLDVSALAPGVYAVEITTASGMNVTRMLKQ